MTQTELAEIVGVTRAAISAIILGRSGTSLASIYHIGKALRICPYRLLQYAMLDYEKPLGARVTP